MERESLLEGSVGFWPIGASLLTGLPPLLVPDKGLLGAAQGNLLQTRYMTLETLATMSDDPLFSLPAVQA